MDVFDNASECELAQTQIALNNHLNANKSKFMISETQCVHCDNAIPEARRQAIQGCQYCVTCQGLAEQGKL